jgi:O-acetylhomoserine/O-acetylserine sulfhydrylase-like pyridoxal-dependent enzyme
VQGRRPHRLRLDAVRRHAHAARVNLKKLGIETTFVHPISRKIRGSDKTNTKLIYAETLGNPLINIVDIEALAKIAHEAEIPLVVDNTVPSPYLCRPMNGAPTSWCTRRPSTSAATAPPWAA